MFLRFLFKTWRSMPMAEDPFLKLNSGLWGAFVYFLMIINIFIIIFRRNEILLVEKRKVPRRGSAILIKHSKKTKIKRKLQNHATKHANRITCLTKKHL